MVHYCKMNICDIVDIIEQHSDGVAISELALFYSVDVTTTETFIMDKCTRGDLDVYGNPTTTPEVELASQLFFLPDGVLIHIKHLGYVEKRPGAWGFITEADTSQGSAYDISSTITNQYGSNMGIF